MAADPPKLTEKQRRFVAEYAADPNATQAYLRAFGRLKSNGKTRSMKVASESARRLLAKPEIQAELEAANAEYAQRTRVSKQRVLREAAAVAFADPADAFDPDPQGGPLLARPLHQIPAATRRAIQSVKVKRRRIAGNKDEIYEVEEVEYKFASKLDALDKLCKRLGFYSDEASGPKDGKAVIILEDNGRDGPAEQG
jgi:phage terminase small subunit